MNQILIRFDEVPETQVRDVVALVGAIPHLCRGTLLDCDLAVERSSGGCAVAARFSGPVPEVVRARLAFWVGWAGGCLELEPRPGAFSARSPLEAFGPVRRNVGPRVLRRAADRLLRAMEGSRPGVEPGRLTLRLAVGGPAEAALRFDQRREALFVPSVWPPPLGERVAFQLRLPDGSSAEGAGTVASLCVAGEEGPGNPPGFTLALANPSMELLAALAAHVGPASQAARRRAPRHPVRARAAVRAAPLDAAPGDVAAARLTYATPEELAEDWVENLSQGGAFVRTKERLPVGSRIRLILELPGGEVVEAPGVVAHAGDRGLGIRFELDDVGEAQLAAAVAALVSRRRRALVVDDDQLSRRMLGDALAGSGFDVIAAGDGVSGLRVLSEELLGLDLLVTDLRMPFMDGERLLRLIREAGGERDLAILVVTGEVSDALESRLMSAGADAVIPKGSALRQVGEVARTVLQRRHRMDGGLEIPA